MPVSQDKHLQQAAASDLVAEQFFKNYGTSSLPMLWAGRPHLRWGFWGQMLLLLLLALGLLALSFHSLVNMDNTGFWGLLFTVLAIGNILFMSVAILGVISLSRSNLTSYYAFDVQQLYLYSAYSKQARSYELAALPDFVTMPNRDGTTTLRCSFRKTKNKSGRIYKTPILYALPNGQATFNLLRATQQAAKQQALDELSTPSWLPLD